MPNFNSLNNGLAHQHNNNNNNNNSIFDDFLPPLIQMSNPGSQWPATPSATTTPSSSCTEDFISDSSSSDSLFFDLPKSSAPGHSTLRSNNIPGNAANPNYVDDFFALNTAPGNSGSPLLSSLEPSYQQPFLSLQHQQFQHQQKLPPLDVISPALTVPGSFI